MSSFLRAFVTNSHSFLRRTTGYTRTFSEAPAGLRVKLSADGKGLALFSGVTPEESHYHVKWLRHNCQCSQCLSSSGQKTVTADHLMRDDNIERVKLLGDKLLVEWTAHSGWFDVNWLISNHPSSNQIVARKEATPAHPTTKLPFMRYKEIMDPSNEGLYNWLYHLSAKGVCIITGVPADKEHTVKVAHRLGEMQSTVDGECFDVIAVPKEELTNIADSEVGLELHMDLQYYQSPPGLQILHCIRNDPCVEGGESTLLDGLEVVERLRETHPRQFEILSKVQVPFQKIRQKGDFPVKMEYRKPHIELDHNDQVIGINWSPAQQGTLSPHEDEIEEYYEAYTNLFKLFNDSPLIIEYRLNPGEVLSFNNRRFLHGRRPYASNGGQRHLAGFYINIDEFASKLAALSKTLGKSQPLKHVLNTSYYN
ncbi:PREDICTED: gamma-butyrobetaine dioxygenase-like [Amphimedon queenslandica]|uniref:Gamma-butyrobetaine dioxygenase n=1 Tax=Amphimedon queenslandica TaxID=400682 RepID=A0A1X7V8D4_AMPQE|nr:PREDICTED: gamma-butyrobetaine dioxygenase-like [Amphimedon queenslandica]|eukprot:XP_011402900.2 PREDICTED: gamma-butyrobetaine dioxygenase-like [Amphimedon queenslandica]